MKLILFYANKYREMERQRQMEWENQKLQDLQQLRQKEQENILRLKAQNQSLTIELTTLNDKVGLMLSYFHHLFNNMCFIKILLLL